MTKTATNTKTKTLKTMPTGGTLLHLLMSAQEILPPPLAQGPQIAFAYLCDDDEDDSDDGDIDDHDIKDNASFPAGQCVHG